MFAICSSCKWLQAVSPIIGFRRITGTNPHFMLTQLEPVQYQAVQTGVYNHSYACTPVLKPVQYNNLGVAHYTRSSTEPITSSNL